MSEGPEAAASKDGALVETTEIQIQMANIGINDGIPYAKADIVAACKLGQSFAVSFYQFDYQSVISTHLALEAIPDRPKDAKPLIPTKPIPIAKIVLDEEGFKRLLTEVNRIADKVGLRG
jgi:hypothetical protein